jgi:hypothetical protein
VDAATALDQNRAQQQIDKRNMATPSLEIESKGGFSH